MTLFRRMRRLVAGSATAAALTLGLVVLALQFSSPANARSASSSCADAVTGAPTGPATISAASTAYGQVLVVGSGDHAGCSLYLLTSDQLHSMTSAPFACSDNPNPLGAPCDSILWPALLTDGAPIAGPGVNPTLLGTVTRDDMPFGGSVQQVTYAGQPLYRFIFDEAPGETEGANLFDPVTSPTGTWYLVDPSQGHPATGQAHLQLETALVTGGRSSETVLAAVMNNDFSLFPNASFPVYTLSTDSGPRSACQGLCALSWQPVLTSARGDAGAGVDQHGVGIIVRSDGTHQVTYNDKPLYLFVGDAYIAGLPGIGGPASINGAGAATPWGIFNTIPPSP
jgi:predicted lipoprotein with Yx(FWY)xxD motif